MEEKDDEEEKWMEEKEERYEISKWFINKTMSAQLV